MVGRGEFLETQLLQEPTLTATNRLVDRKEELVGLGRLRSGKERSMAAKIHWTTRILTRTELTTLLKFGVWIWSA